MIYDVHLKIGFARSCNGPIHLYGTFLGCFNSMRTCQLSDTKRQEVNNLQCEVYVGMNRGANVTCDFSAIRKSAASRQLTNGVVFNQPCSAHLGHRPKFMLRLRTLMYRLVRF